MSQATVEQRLQTLEKAVADLQRRLEQNGSTESTQDWLKRISGSMKDDPEFEEVLRLGREFRQADRPPDED